MRKNQLALLCFLFLCCFSVHVAQAAGRSPSISMESGFYPSDIQLEITHSKKDAILYYTLDGTAPDENALLYTGPVSLGSTTDKHDPLSQITGVSKEEDYTPPKDFPSAHVIRAAALLPGGEWTPEVCGTYFIGFDRNALYGDFPIISLIMDPQDLYDYEKGIYVLGKVYDEWHAQQTRHYDVWEVIANYTGRGKEWEREVMVDFLMEEGENFCQLMGVRIKGGASRFANQKSLRLIAREEYGKKNVKYPLFPDNYREYDGKLLEKYKSFSLRSGGNDRDFGRIRDPYIQQLADGLHLETAATRPVIAFINGEFWGIYTLLEEYSDNYIQYHYDIDNENVITFKANRIEDGLEEDASLYWDMYHFITENPMSNPEYYEKASQMLDMQSFADFLALNLYIYNQDGLFQNNNWQMWRARIPGQDDSPYADGRWRMMVYDVDYSAGIYDNGQNFRVNNLLDFLYQQTYDANLPGRMAQALLNNEDFKRMLIISLCDVHSLYFTADRVQPLYTEMKAQYTPYVLETYLRFGPRWVLDQDAEKYLNRNMTGISNFFNGRTSAMANLTKKAFGLKNPITITVQLSDPEKGAVYINGRDIPVKDGQKIYYFREYPITITAAPADGASFAGWKLNNTKATLQDDQALTTTVTFTDYFTLTAQFD